MATNKSPEYFSHDSNAKDDPKIMIMMAQLGLEAYGIYWILIEYLREQPEYRAPLAIIDALSRRFGSSKEKFEAVVTKFSLFEWDDHSFFSPSLNRRMIPLESKRENMRQLALKRWNENAYAMRTHSTGNAQAMQSKVKESKVKLSKVKESKEEKKKTDFSSFVLNSNQLLIKKWDEWCEFRKLLKKPYKTTTGAAAAYNKLLSLSDSNSETAIAIINQSIENEWIGFFPLRVTNKPGTIPGEDPVAKMVREMKEVRARQAAQKTA